MMEQSHTDGWVSYVDPPMTEKEGRSTAVQSGGAFRHVRDDLGNLLWSEWVLWSVDQVEGERGVSGA